MYHFIYTITFFLVLLIFPSQGYSLPIAKVTVKAIDEEGKPIAGAKVHMSFSIPKKGDWGLDDIFKQGITDREGKFTESSECYPNMGFSVDKEGYYQSGDGIEFNKTQGLLDKRWKPWNQTIEVVLKKKRNPVPMYIKPTGWVKVPVQNIPVGYDLERGDWVKPYGRGILSDFIFLFTSNIRAYREYDMKMVLMFENQHDGIQEFSSDHKDQSLYRWPFEAPLNNYKNELIKKIHKLPGVTDTNINRDAKYIFRVRSETNDNGEITMAKYGKIASEFELSPEGADYMIRFYYFYNPDGTRNLEDVKDQNLFKPTAKH